MQKHKLPEHSEVPVELTWDLAPVYQNKEEWEKDFIRIKPMVRELLKFRGRLAESPTVLRDAIVASDDMERLAEKLYTWAHLLADENTAKSAHQALEKRMSSLFAEISGDTAWFEPEILAIEEKVMTQFLADPILKLYKRSLEELLRTRPHTLSAAEERIIGLVSEVTDTAADTYSTLSNADLEFPAVTNERGETVPLTHGNYINFLESNSREVRKNAFDAMFGTYKKFRNTFASTLNGAVKNHTVTAQIRNFPSALEASLFEDNVPVAVYNNLITSVRAKLPVLDKYLKFRAECMGLEKLNMYDMLNPLIPKCKVEAEWKETVKWVKDALKPLGKEYCSILDKAFTDRWIDVMECKGKRSGGYSSGCYDSPPYILLNFTGTLHDVFTLAHELGHSMHSYYSNHTQHYHYSEYSIFVAEVASTTNELLLYHYLMKQNPDRNFQAYLLCHLADQIRSTVYRQTMFAEFEKMIHEKTEHSEPLTADMLCEEYFKLNADYYGRHVVPDQNIAMEWARIPHFYYNFYVYKYATGFAAAAKLSRSILSGSKEKLDAYLGFLKAGDSKDALDIMKDAGVDLSTPEPVTAALNEFDTAITMLQEKLHK